MMGKDERECVKVPYGEYLKVPDDSICVAAKSVFAETDLLNFSE